MRPFHAQDRELPEKVNSLDRQPDLTTGVRRFDLLDEGDESVGRGGDPRHPVIYHCDTVLPPPQSWLAYRWRMAHEPRTAGRTDRRLAPVGSGRHRSGQTASLVALAVAPSGGAIETKLETHLRPSERWKAVRAFLGIVSRADVGSTADDRARATAQALGRADRLIRRSFPSREAPQATTWRSPDGAIALVTWDNESQVSTRSAQRQAGRGAVTDAGYVVGSVSDMSIASTSDLLDLSTHIGGCFAIARANEDCVEAVTDSTRSVNIFSGESRRLRVLGTRALLVHLMLESDRLDADDPDPVYNGLALRQMAMQGHFFGGTTPYIGVCAEPAATAIRLDRWYLRRTEAPARATAAALSHGDRADLVEDVANRLVDSFAPFAGSEVGIRLSGGRDSRLIAAAAVHHDIRLDSATSGVPDHADVVLAAQIASTLGIPHRIIPPAGVRDEGSIRAEDPTARIVRNLDVHDAMTSAWDDIDDYGPMRAISGISGVGGEVLRGGLILPDVDQLTPEIATSRLRTTMSGGPFFSKSLDDAAKAFAAPLLELAATDPYRAIDDYYYIHRNGRWVAARRSSARFRTLSFDPLLDSRLIRAVRGVPARYRWDERLVFDVVARLAPRLRDLPMEGRRWRFERHAPVPDSIDLARTWNARKAISSPDSVAKFDWKRLGHPVAREAVLEVIMDGVGALDGLVDRAKLETYLSHTPFPYPTVVWHLATCVVMLSNDWHRTLRPSKVESLELAPVRAGRG